MSKIFLVVVLILAALGGYVVYNVFRDRPVDNLCTEVLPHDQRVGLKMDTTGDKTIKVDFGGQRSSPSGASPQQIELFIRCLETTRKVVVENGVRLPLEPVGQLANRWQREQGLKIRLMSGKNDEALNNLGFGPAAGVKEGVVRDWCSPQKAGACVVCDPAQPGAQDVEVVVRLRDKAPVVKARYGDKWPVPPPGTKLEPWQLVDRNGERFYYECKPGK